MKRYTQMGMVMAAPVIESLCEACALLVAHGLKSRSSVVARLLALIDAARAERFSHQSIHAALSRGGLEMDMNAYRVALRRARHAAQASGVALPPRPASDGSAPKRAALHLPAPLPENAMSATGQPSRGSATFVMDALVAARAEGNKDYSRIAREHFRKRQA